MLLYAQNVGIGTTAPHASAQLYITANNKGVLIPRVQLTRITDVVTISSPTRSLLVYNTLSEGSGATAVIQSFYYWNGFLGESLATTSNIANSAWSLGGNTGTNANLNYLGTTDLRSLMFKVSNSNAGYLGINGNSFWGISSGKSSAGANNSVNNVYDELGRILTVTYAAGSKKKYSYTTGKVFIASFDAARVVDGGFTFLFNTAGPAVEFYNNYDPTYKTLFAYNNSKQLMGEFSEHLGDTTFKNYHMYNADGNRIAETTFNGTIFNSRKYVTPTLYQPKKM